MKIEEKIYKKTFKNLIMKEIREYDMDIGSDGGIIDFSILEVNDVFIEIKEYHINRNTFYFKFKSNNNHPNHQQIYELLKKYYLL